MLRTAFPLHAGPAPLRQLSLHSPAAHSAPSRHRVPLPLPSAKISRPTSLQARFIPFDSGARTPQGAARGRGMSWNRVLEDYARLRRPEKELPAGVWVTSDRHTTTIFDGFEKAKFHLLILPRDPFVLPDGSKVPSAALSSLRSLLASPHALPVLRALKKQADEVQEMIRDEMEKEYGWAWDVQCGFHAVESMRHVHVHVISTDFISPKLKNKKHWNSFHPSLGYFLHLSDVLAAVESGQEPLAHPKEHYENLLKSNMRSIYPPYAEFPQLPRLKEHLEVEWEAKGRQNRREEKEAPAAGS